MKIGDKVRVVNGCYAAELGATGVIALGGGHVITEQKEDVHGYA
jgi:hypothetical protein